MALISIPQAIEIVVFGVSILTIVYRLGKAEAQIRSTIEMTKLQAQGNDKGLKQLFENKLEILEKDSKLFESNINLTLQQLEFKLATLQEELDRRVGLLYRNQKRLADAHLQIIGYMQRNGFKVRGKVRELEADYKNTYLPLEEVEGDVD